MDGGNSSHIKFGGYDESAFVQECHMIKSYSNSEWALPYDKLTIGNTEYYSATVDGDKEPKLAEFNPAYPYIYLPNNDFATFSKNFNNKMKDVDDTFVCQNNEGYCRASISCKNFIGRSNQDL